MITEILLNRGQLDEALVWINRGIDVAEAHDEKIYLAEMHRFKGLISQRQGDKRVTIEQINQAIAVAKANGHKLFELRARVSLCQAFREFGDSTVDATAELKLLVETFPAGSENLDLKSAQELL